MPEPRKLNDWISNYLKFTSNDEPRESFRKFVAISTVAACLQRKCYTNWEKIIYPNLYIVLVGPPASRKNTAIEPAEEMLREIGIEVSAQATTREALIRRLRKIGEKISISENTLTPNTDASMTIISSEFTVFIGIKNLHLIALLTDWYDCKNDWTYETKGQGIDSIKNVWVNLQAATTPTALKDSLPHESVGMGLTSRIIFIFEEDKAKIIFFSPNVDVLDEKTGKAKKLDMSSHYKWEELRDDLIHDLNIISMMEGAFIPTGEFHNAYMEWRNNHEKNMPFKGTMLENYSNRKQTHLRKIAMIFSASRGDDMILTLEDFNFALTSLDEVEVKMARTFSGMGKSDVAETMDRVMRYIATKKVVKLSELQKVFWQDADKPTLERMILTCEDMKICKREFRGNEVVLIYLEEEIVIKVPSSDSSSSEQTDQQ